MRKDIYCTECGVLMINVGANRKRCDKCNRIIYEERSLARNREEPKQPEKKAPSMTIDEVLRLGDGKMSYGKIVLKYGL